MTNHLPKTLPWTLTITLGIRFQHMNLFFAFGTCLVLLRVYSCFYTQESLLVVWGKLYNISSPQHMRGNTFKPYIQYQKRPWNESRKRPNTSWNLNAGNMRSVWPYRKGNWTQTQSKGKEQRHQGVYFRKENLIFCLQDVSQDAQQNQEAESEGSGVLVHIDSIK